MQQLWRRNATRKGLLLASVAFAIIYTTIHVASRSLPPLEQDEWDVLKAFPPRNIAVLLQQREVALRYAARQPRLVLASWTAAYIIMQTCAIPGTISLSLLSGALYGAVRGWILVAVVSTIGSCCCYGVGKIVGRPLAASLWPDKLDSFSKEVDKRRGDLLFYIIFLRITPLLPNTFINIASPIVGVPFQTFFLGTLLGCGPNNWLAVNAGRRLGELHSLAELADGKMLLYSCVVGAIALAPVWWRHGTPHIKQ